MCASLCLDAFVIPCWSLENWLTPSLWPGAQVRGVVEETKDLTNRAADRVKGDWERTKDGAQDMLDNSSAAREWREEHAPAPKVHCMRLCLCGLKCIRSVLDAVRSHRPSSVYIRSSLAPWSNLHAPQPGTDMHLHVKQL